jgi:hypothetical protein
MKRAIVLGLLTTIISGCVTQPMSPVDRAYRLQVIRAMMQSRYQLPMPQPMTVPQTRSVTVNCNTAGVITTCMAQ